MTEISITTTAKMTPTRLDYVAALRGIVPRPQGAAYTYGNTGVSDTETFLALAASNTEGQFYGILSSSADVSTAQALAQERGVTNVTFTTEISSLPQLDYLVYNSTRQSKPLSFSDLASLAKNKVKEGGICAHRYMAYESVNEILRFLVREFSPEMTPPQAITFLDELKALGSLYFASNAIERNALEGAIAKKIPDEFFALCDNGKTAHSGSFDFMVSMMPGGFLYAGDADVGFNYMEMVAPSSAHETLIKCSDNLLYETIKDFAIRRLERCDIWCKMPVQQTDNIFSLYNNFTFGTLLSSNAIPTRHYATGKDIDLSVAPYPALTKLMSLMPVSLGDCVAQPTLAAFTPEQITQAVQVLVACNIAVPMRGSYTGIDKADITHPKWATAFNASLTMTSISSEQITLASPVIGGPIKVSARDALVIQAINRAGMANSVSALVPEMQRIIQYPSLAMQVLGKTELTPDFIQVIIREVVNRSMIQWYTYGILAA